MTLRQYLSYSETWSLIRQDNSLVLRLPISWIRMDLELYTLRSPRVLSLLAAEGPGMGKESEVNNL